MLVSMKRDVLDRAASAKGTESQRRTLSDRVLGVIVAVAILLGLGAAGTALAISLGPQPSNSPAGALSTPTPSRTPSPTPVSEYDVATATPTPPPIDPLLTVTTIVVRPERLDLADAAGTVVREVSYDDDTAQIVGALTIALGEEPTLEERSADGVVVSRDYAWPGLIIMDSLRSGPGHLPMNVMVRFEQPTLGDGVAVLTVAGFAPGDDLAAYATSVGEPYSPEGYAENLVPLEVGPELGPSYDPNHPSAYTVAASDWGIDNGPSTVFAPFDFGRNPQPGLPPENGGNAVQPVPTGGAAVVG
ncbi:hypothetical protein ASD23_03780 [Agromyces sp. Root1464]|nr:hypothetical protein ASD23_03780 [Agromyces sp. Root1464]